VIHSFEKGMMKPKVKIIIALITVMANSASGIIYHYYTRPYCCTVPYAGLFCTTLPLAYSFCLILKYLKPAKVIFFIWCAGVISSIIFIFLLMFLRESETMFIYLRYFVWLWYLTVIPIGILDVLSETLKFSSECYEFIIHFIIVTVYMAILWLGLRGLKQIKENEVRQ
jgi:hypothetical protein